MDVFRNLINANAMLCSEERLALAHAAGSLAPDSVIFDLGTSAGGSADIFLQSSPESSVYTIDISDKIHRPLWDDERLNIYHGNADQFVADHPGLHADMVFIDASHYLFDAAHDFETMSKVTKDKAVMAFHDCLGPKFPGIMVLCKTLADNGNIVNVQTFHSLFAGDFIAGVPFPDAELFAENIGQLGSMLDIWLPAKVAHTSDHTRRMEKMFDSLRAGKADAPWIVGQGDRGQTFARFVGFDESRLVHSSDVTDDDPSCIVCSYYFGEIQGYLRSEKGARPDSVLDSLAVIQYGFYEDLAFNQGKATMALAKTDFQRDVVRHLATQPAAHLERLYRYGCFWNVLEDLFIR
ncbi:MAG: class I SAM-dependent methyltransferase [Pseudodesulfovibrio sp.]